MKKLTPDDFNTEAFKFSKLVEKIIQDSQKMEKVYKSLGQVPTDEQIFEVLELYDQAAQTYQDISLSAANLALILGIMKKDLSEKLVL